MASLAQLLAHHDCILALDAASTETQVGLLHRAGPPVWHRSTDEAGKSLFKLTDACLQETGLRLDAVRAFLFCAGPGSMLGIRTAAMALRTWQALAPRPVYRYESLALLARELASAGHPAPFSVIADARRDTWHTVTVDATGRVLPLQRVPTAELSARPETIWRPTAFRAWSQLPRAASDCPYDLAAILARHPDADWFELTDAPDAFQHEAPDYKKWSAQVHSAATAPRK